MLIYKVESYRYYSDLAGFDIVIVVESGKVERMNDKLEEIICSWFDSETDEPIGDYIKSELYKIGVEVSIYNTTDTDEDF